MKVVLTLLGFLFLISCWTTKEVTRVPAQKTLCDTIGEYLSSHPEMYTTRIENIDVNKNVYTTKLGQKDCYQINIKHIPNVTSYNLRFNDIDFIFKIGDPDCELNGDMVYCFVDQLTLGNACIERGYFETRSSFDCMYRTNWTISVRPIFCEKYYGPFSKPLVGVSLQCNAPEKY